MDLLREKRGFPKFPVDLSSKGGQKLLKEITHECQHELFEANQHLKNSKSHRVTDVSDFDRAAYLEELVDSLHYYLEIAIASGVTPDELFEAYMEKGNTNFKRIEGGY